MKSFRELLEMQIKPEETKTFPHPKGEQRFWDRHTVKDVLAAYRKTDTDKAVFNGGGVPTFNRSKNRFGRDQNQSITAYESEQLDEIRKNTGRRHIYINGQYAGTASYSKNRKEALKSWLRDHPGMRVTGAHVAQESFQDDVETALKKHLLSKDETSALGFEKVNEISKNILNRYLEGSAAWKAKAGDELAPLSPVKNLTPEQRELLKKKFEKRYNSFEKTLKKVNSNAIHASIHPEDKTGQK